MKLRCQRWNERGEERSVLHFAADLVQGDAQPVLDDCSTCTEFVKDRCDRKCCTTKYGRLREATKRVYVVMVASRV